MWRVLVLAVFAAGLLVGCGEEADEADREPLTTTEVEMLAADFEAVAAGQVAAWNAGDVTAFRQVYTEDIEHHDGQLEMVGLDSIAGMAERMFERYPDWDGRLDAVYVGGNDAVGVWEVANVLEFDHDNPLIEYDLLEVRDGRIAAWTLYYHPETMPAFTQPPGQPEAEAALLANYATAWSSDDAAAVAALYAAEAIRSDPLFGHMSEGRNDVESYAAEWFDWYPDVSIELVQPIAEASRDEPITGAIFAVRPAGDEGSCEVRMAVLLQTNDAEQIVGERAYYDVDSLIDCGWAG